MRLRPLTRLRLGFLALGIVLLTPLGFLMSAVSDRLEAQRGLRHEMVAERIFDELERELTAVLAGESARPSSAYDESTSSAAWAPFVVGYFKTRTGGTELLAAEQLSEDRKRRLTAAVDGLEQAKNNPVAQAPVRQQAEFAPKSSPDVLRKLNRSQEVRSLSVPGTARPRGPSHDDPMKEGL